MAVLPLWLPFNPAWKNRTSTFVQEVFVYRLYLSADEQTEFVAYSTNDVIYAEGFGEWAATFQPFNPDHLDLLEL